MSVNDGVLVRKVTVIIAVYKEAACKIIFFFKGAVEIIIIIFSLHYRIGNVKGADTQPAGDIFIYLLQL